MKRVVFDTNILISALLFKKSKTRKVYDLAKQGLFSLYLSEFILEEFRKVVTEKFRMPKIFTERHILRLRKIAYIVESKEKTNIIKEHKEDNRILECALSAKAHYLVTGGTKHILPLKEFKGIKIVSPSEFLEVPEIGPRKIKRKWKKQ